MRLIVTGGGTGGHIYPALSIAQALQKRFPDGEILYIGTKKGLESQVVPSVGIPFRTVEIEGLNRSSRIQALRSSMAVPSALRQAWRIIHEFNPNVIVGTGGYVSFPVVLAGTFFDCRTYIHEQNAFPGLTNRLLSKRVDATLLTFPEARVWLKGRRIIETGLPVRSEFLQIDRYAARKELNLHPDFFTLLVFGGSLGAQSINRTVQQLMDRYINDPIQVIWITGKGHHESIAETLSAEMKNKVQIYPYFLAMEKAMAAADLVICRSGAGTLSELAIVGLPAVLIPYPLATGDHQMYNARAFEQKQAAVVISDAALSVDELHQAIEEIRNRPERLSQMRENMSSLARPDAIDGILREITS